MNVTNFLSSVVLCKAYANAHVQQPATISGSAMNQNGEALQGATVVKPATKNTTVTD